MQGSLNAPAWYVDAHVDGHPSLNAGWRAMCPPAGGVGARNHRAKFAKVAFAYQQVVNVLEVNVEDYSAQGRAHVTERRCRAVFGIQRLRDLENGSRRRSARQAAHAAGDDFSRRSSAGGGGQH